MNRFKEYDLYDGLGLAELVKRREVSALELFDEAVYRYQRTHASVNAIVIPLLELGRQQAKTLDAGDKCNKQNPFIGVPFLVKNLLTDIAGTEITRGSAALKGNICRQTSDVANRYLKAGVTIFGRTNCSELGLTGFTEPTAYGPTTNPWQKTYGAGGSSGGSAAAVAARIVPLAGASDGGGSIRIPAAHCGLFGLKPSRGRTPATPLATDHWDGAAIEHVVTLSVRDSAAMLDQISVAKSGVAHTIVPPKTRFADIIKKPVRSLKIGFTYQSPVDTAVDFECINAAQHAAKILAQLGHKVEEVTFPVDGNQLAKAFFMLYYGQAAAELSAISTQTNVPITRLDIEDITYLFGLMGRKLSASSYISFKQSWHDMAQQMEQFHRQYDLLLTPTLGKAPKQIGELQPKFTQLLQSQLLARLGSTKLIFSQLHMKRLAKTGLSPYPFTQLANLTGQPAMSVPLYWTANNLPCGVQFVAPMGDEATLFQLAKQLEEAEPWFDKRPAICAEY